MKQIPGFMMRHRVKVEEFIGTNSVGEVYGPKVEIRCHYADKVKMVRNSSGEDVSSSSFYITTPDHRPAENSRVTTPYGDVRKVIGLDSATWPGMSVPANVQVYLD